MDSKELQDLEYFASLLLTNEELEDVLQLPRGSLEPILRTTTDERAIAIRKGRLKRKCELHESLLNTALRHSTPALQMSIDLLRKIEP